ncbi:MAG: ATP-binding protein, partial [Betaproteobacteria bacterium]|nr:ATP-binding protein [Betaproteobacteria bacterium]
TGPRQSGKTTLLRHALPQWRMVSLEDLDLREFAREDPRGFLARNAPPLVIDEAQHVPALFSYIQTAVDASGEMGRYILSGSQQFSLLARITQSLAGRAALLDLLPLRLRELADAGRVPESLDALLLQGGYPAVYARGVEAHSYYADYVRSYVERDVRTLTAVQDLGNFQRFLRLCAARTGQLLNLSALANDCGIAQPTAAAWMNVLEASFVARRVAPYHRNFGKRLVKTPRLYFLDTGLCAWLLGISNERDLANHFARGALFETWAVTEALKWRAARGDARPLYFWRDNIGNEVDLVLEQEGGHTLVEIKAGQTFQTAWLKAMDTVERHIAEPVRRALIYGGDTSFERAGTTVLGWRDLRRAG